MPGNKHNKYVAVVRFSALGDVAMTIPVLYSACACHQDVQFLMITKPRITELFVNPPDNLTVIGFDPVKRFGRIKRSFDEILAKYPIEALADLQNDSTTRIMRLLCRLHGSITTKKIDTDHRGERLLTRRHAKRMLPLVSRRARYREVFYRLGLPVESRFTNLYSQLPPPMIPENICRHKAQGQKWIGIAPFANFTGKIYPVEQMEVVVKCLCSYPDTQIFLFGQGESETRTLLQWSEAHANVTSLAGRYGFSTELALISQLDVMLSMDSANMHLAALVDTPVISVWGATHPYCGFRGWRQSESSTVQLAMTCRPCSIIGNRPCFRGDYYCLKGINPQTIVDKILSVINH